MTGKVLVTGSRGFIGSHLCKKFDELNIPYVGFSGDITNFENVLAQIRNLKIKTVIHFAGISSTGHCEDEPKKAFEVNVLGTFNLLESIKRENKKVLFMFPSTAHVYDCSDEKYNLSKIEEYFPLAPKSIYSKTKLASENLVKSYYKTHAIGESVVLRLFNHTDQSQQGPFFFPQVFKQITETTDNIVEIETGDLSLIRDFSLVNDLIEAIALLSQKEQSSKFEIYNMCSGEGRILKDLIIELGNQLNKKITFKQDVSKYRPKEPKAIIGANQKIALDHGISYPKRTNEEFIRDFLLNHLRITN